MLWTSVILITLYSDTYIMFLHLAATSMKWIEAKMKVSVKCNRYLVSLDWLLYPLLPKDGSVNQFTYSVGF